MITTVYTEENIPIQISLPEAAAVYGWAKTSKALGGKTVLVVGLKREGEVVKDAMSRVSQKGVRDPQEVERTAMRSEVWGLPDSSGEQLVLRFVMVSRDKLPKEYRDLLSIPGAAPTFIPTDESVLEGNELLRGGAGILDGEVKNGK